MRTAGLSSLALACGAALVQAGSYHWPSVTLSGSAVGEEVQIDSSGQSFPFTHPDVYYVLSLTWVSVVGYLSRPHAHNAKNGTAVLFLTDVYGLPLQENKLYVSARTPLTHVHHTKPIPPVWSTTLPAPAT